MDKTSRGSLIGVFLRGEATSTFWNLGAKGAGLFNTFLTISSLTLYQYGIFQLLLSISGLSFDAVGLGSGVISNEIARAVGEKRESDAKKIYLEYAFVRLLIAVVLWGAVFFGSPVIFRSYDFDFVRDLSVISFLFLAEALFLTMKVLCVIRMRFDLIGIRATLNKLIQSGILIFFFAQGNLGLKQLIWSVVLASVGSLLLVTIPFLRVLERWSGVTASTGKLLFSIFIKNGLWEVARQFVNKATFRVRPWLIKLVISTEAVAVFSVAELIISTIQDVLPSNALQSIVPLWLRDKKLSSRMFSFGVKYYFFIGMLFALLSFFIVPPVVAGLFPKYANSIPLFRFMVLNIPIFAVGIVTGNYVIAHRKQKFLFFLHLSRNLTSLTIILITLPIIGLWGLALESVLIPLLMTLVVYFYTKKRSPGFTFDGDIIFGWSTEDGQIVRKFFWEGGKLFKQLFHRS